MKYWDMDIKDRDTDNLLDRVSRRWTFLVKGQMKSIEIINGDMCELQEECDIAVCSAFRGNYTPIWGTMIHSLYCKRGIDVSGLSADPEIDLKTAGAWLSRETGTAFHRIGCIELIDYSKFRSQYEQSEIIVKRGFSTFRYLIEQASIGGIEVGTISMPLLGTGSQMIELEYILGPMITQCKRLIESEDGVNRIVIYERNIQKTRKAITAFENALPKTADSEEVFISYSTKQAYEAGVIFDYLSRNHISCWMAPQSIPTGSSYIERIPSAISRIKTMLVILTPDAEKSRWVRKEIGSAIGANKSILPYMLCDFAMGMDFTFLLEDEQILSGHSLNGDTLAILYRRIVELNSQIENS